MATTAEPGSATNSETTSRRTTVKGWGTDAPDQPLRPMEFERRALRSDDLAIRITFAGICHSDLHQCRNDWHNSIYPVVPGHEIIGEVTAVGPRVTKYKVGDTVAVGTIVDADLTCRECVAGWEQFCLSGSTLTYNGVDKVDGTITKGGYSDHIVVREHFVFAVPKGLDPARAAPLLCAGITTWSPLRQYPEHVGPDREVAVAGLGGLGHLGVKFAAALGARVTMITTSPEKAADARMLGAHDVIISRNPDEMAAAANRFHFILDTIPVAHEIDPYLALLRRGGRMVVVGALDPLPSIHGISLIWGNKAVGGSGVGGVPETQEMLEFCAEHDIHPDIETVAMKDVNGAYERLLRNDVRYRFVIDMSRGL
ncbi:MAG: alcohol dehydrogenase [Sphingomonadales bacterium]|nr:alcohol dehydrogenase [Sphingomonadales bacterium]